MKTFNPYKLFNGSFIPEAISKIPKQELSDGAKIVYGRLMRYSGKDGICKPKRKTMLGEIGYKSLSTLDRKIKELVDFPLIQTSQRGLGKSNEYEFLLNPILDDNPQERVARNVTGGVTETSTVGTPSIQESQVKRIKEETEIKVETAYSNLPENFGKTRLLRLLNLYSRYYKKEYNIDYQANFPRFGKALKNFDDLSEMQLAILVITHFNWRGMDGSDDFNHKRLFNATFPIEWLVGARNQYVAYLTNVEKVDWSDEKAVYTFVGKQLATLS